MPHGCDQVQDLAVLALLLKMGQFLPQGAYGPCEYVGVPALASRRSVKKGRDSVEITCLPLQVEFGVVISLPTYSMETSLHN